MNKDINATEEIQAKDTAIIKMVLEISQVVHDKCEDTNPGNVTYEIVLLKAAIQAVFGSMSLG